ncbi:DNA-binding MarR family transcriptional regulator [Actinocorallia herbida]|uniref:DNA-binding MarR family transcriptional regulator n=1 Tax=Actinocorallia herbida TaxID=58109 RepID=A0A3N1D0W5_9ACTN|nr:MarR family transcriptional regulator [Actinocorallia herbida]ROO86698.1 DNA-binding MarR family transcriptional regulator [Actinocorallia herbida]
MDSAQLADLLMQAAHRIRRGEKQAMAPLGLTPAQARALRVILNAPEPPRMAALADALRIVPRSVTSVIDALEREDLVTRAPDPGNRRAILLHPTAKARGVGARMREARRITAESLFAALSETQRAELGTLLTALTADR